MNNALIINVDLNALCDKPVADSDNGTTNENHNKSAHYGITQLIRSTYFPRKLAQEYLETAEKRFIVADEQYGADDSRTERAADNMQAAADRYNFWLTLGTQLEQAYMEAMGYEPELNYTDWLATLTGPAKAKPKTAAGKDRAALAAELRAKHAA